jgi:hypothetical protein
VLSPCAVSGPKQLPCFHLQSLGQPIKRCELNSARASFEFTDLAPLHASQISEIFLAEVSHPSKQFDVESKYCERGSIGKFLGWPPCFGCWCIHTSEIHISTPACQAP